ncbi:hypothetical protein ACLOJK_034353, partial [Asimina triloba]
LCCRLIWAVVGGRGQQADGGDEAATGTGSGQAMVEAMKAATWQRAARAVERGQLGRSGGDGRDDEWPRSTDPGLADDGNEDRGIWENGWPDELGKKTLCAPLPLIHSWI